MNDIELKEVIATVSTKVVHAVLGFLQNEQGVSLTDAISSTAALAGAYLLDNAGIEMQGLSPGSPIEVKLVSDEGPKILTLMQEHAASLGLNPDTGWDTLIPPEAEPSSDPLELAYLLKPVVTSIFEEFSVPADLRTGLMALTAVQFIFDGKDHLSPEIGKSLALTALIRGSHTVPLNPLAKFE
ncbi:MAG: hypothetical protein K1X83_00275 [Oligoflexia bacterium]|nr:hypothetical protein [Oligoflexia bacterium]